jgi:hypothetical protein
MRNRSSIFLFVIAFAVFVSMTCTAAFGTITTNPVPYIDQPLLPAASAPGGSAFTLTVNGVGFVSTSTVLWNGSPRPTTFISATQLTAAISATDLTVATTAAVTVSSPAPGGGVSNVVFLQVNYPTSSVAYTSATVSAGTVPSVNTLKAVASDFNGDGKQDIATLNSDGSVSVLLGNGHGTFALPVIYNPIPAGPPVRVAQGIVVGDFNGDGRLDIAVSDQYQNDIPPGNSSDVWVLPGNGDGTFGAAFAAFNNQSQGTTGSAFIAADLNGDGKLDLLEDCENSSQTGLCVLTGNGDGTFTLGASVLSPTPSVGAIAATIGDFNGDGKLDVALSYGISGNSILAVALGNGDGTFGTLSTVDSIPNATGTNVAAADFDGDGKQDLAFYATICVSPNPCSGTLQTYSGIGDGTFQSALPSLSAPANGAAILVGDFNGDGILDVAIQDIVLLGRGDGTFAANARPLPQNVTVASDFNGDGNLDFASPATGVGSPAVFVQLRTPADFSGFSSPTSQTAIAGTNTSYDVQVVPLFGWTRDVSLSVSGLPSGVTASFQPVTVPFGSGATLLSISTAASTTPGTYTLTLTGMAGTVSHSTTITLVVNPASADFGGDITPGSQLVAGGQQANYAVQVVSFNGFTGDVTLSVSGMPPGSFVSFNPPVVTGGSGSSILTVVSPTTSQSGAYILTITGTSGSLSHSGKRELDINSTADFTGSVTRIVSSVLPGQRASYTANVISENGFTGTVALSVSGLPAGATARFTPVNVMGGSGSSSLIVTTSSTTPPGAYTLTIAGVSGSDGKSTTIPLLVNTSTGDFVGSIVPTTQSVTAGGAAQYTVTISPLSGFTGNVALSVSGVPAGATASFSPGNVVSGGSGSSILTISTSVATPPGTCSIIVTGTSGGLSHGGSISLTVN